MRQYFRLSTFAGIALLAAGPVWAQHVEEVHFEPGNYGTMVSGSVTGQDFADFTLGAKAGQEMFAELTVAETDGDGTVYFNIMPPDAEWEALYVGWMDDDNSETVALPLDGVYTIRVYLMGNDADTGKTVDFNLDLSIQ